MSSSRRRYIEICSGKLTYIGEIPFVQMKDNAEGRVVNFVGRVR